MDVFKLFESTVPEIQLDYSDAKDLRRDQLLDNYDAAVKALQCLIKAKENEIAYRRALVEMLEQSKSYYEKKSSQSIMESIDDVKRYNPEDTLTPHSNPSTTPISSSSGTTPAGPTTPSSSSLAGGDHRSSGSSSSSYYQPPPLGKDSPDIPTNMPAPSRSSLDSRLSSFLKTFPNLSQAGLLAPSTTTGTTTTTTQDNNDIYNNINNVRPSPGYYTQQTQPPLLPPTSSMTAVPPLMAMMRYPPPQFINNTNNKSLNNTNKNNK